MAYRGQYTIFCLHFGKKHYTFGFLLSSTMKERGEKMEKDKKENGDEISGIRKYTSENFHLGNEGVIQ